MNIDGDALISGNTTSQIYISINPATSDNEVPIFSQLNNTSTDLQTSINNTSSNLQTQINTNNTNLNNTSTNLQTQINNTSTDLQTSINNTSTQLQNQINNLQYLFQASNSTTQFTITHNLNNMYVDVTCYDQNNNIIMPDNIQVLNANQVQVVFDYALQPIIKITV